MDIKVSVIIPTYKRSEFLTRAIDSILNQTYENIEVVVVDDNDPNSSYRLETESKMSKYSDQSKVVYIKNEKNLGGALARNQGIMMATGDYITFLDDDDVYLPHKISIQIDYMLKNAFDMSFTDVRIHNMDDKLMDYRSHPYITSTSNEELLKLHILHHLTPTATYMYKKTVLTTLGGFDDVKMGQEFMLMLKTIERGFKIGYIPNAYVIQYIHDGERISVGQNKISAEKELFNFKKQYFEFLSPSQRNYVNFRHHAVMMIVGLRSKQPMVAIRHLFEALFVSPIDCVRETINHIKKINKQAARSFR
jgi:glycosyltransferase involved in cell wall biosynthesis